MRTIPAEQFKKQFGEETYGQFGVQKKPGLLSELKSRISGVGNRIGQQFRGEGEFAGQSTPRRATGITGEAFSTPLGLAKDVLPEPAEKGLEKVGEGIGKGLQWVAEKTTPQFMTEFVTKYPDAAKALEEAAGTVSNVGQIAGDILAIQGGATVAGKATKGLAKTGEKALGIIEKPLEVAGKAIDIKAPQISENIMNRVARLNPTDEIKFKTVAGKTPGQYLRDTGNFGTPDQVVAREAIKFVQSMNAVDDAFSKLPGEFKIGPIDDALRMLEKKAAKTSTPSVKAPFSDEVTQLATKHQASGLTMKEVNRVKRLLEREVKLGYNKLNAPNTVAKATNVDNSIRQWQFAKAKDLGFKNVGEMNKQTQISKFLVNKLGDKIVGQSALNNLSLTDWVMLSGGDPTAIAGFLTKKFFSSKAVQSKIAKLLAGESKDFIKPQTFKPAGFLESSKGPIELPGEGILRGQSKLR